MCACHCASWMGKWQEQEWVRLKSFRVVHTRLKVNFNDFSWYWISCENSFFYVKFRLAFFLFLSSRKYTACQLLIHFSKQATHSQLSVLLIHLPDLDCGCGLLSKWDPQPIPQYSTLIVIFSLYFLDVTHYCGATWSSGKTVVIFSCPCAEYFSCLNSPIRHQDSNSLCTVWALKIARYNTYLSLAGWQVPFYVLHGTVSVNNNTISCKHRHCIQSENEWDTVTPLATILVNKAASHPWTTLSKKK